MRLSLPLAMLCFVVFAAMLLPLAIVPADAHHGWSGYDRGNALDVTGVIRESGYEHPHGHVKFEVSGKTWLVILAPPSRMERRGLTSDMLKAGTKATVMGYPHREHAEEMRAERITIAGKTVELR
ncbi:MAG: DUF6152 family protein [Candidatus Rokuibacteriota bacterium]